MVDTFSGILERRREMKNYEEEVQKKYAKVEEKYKEAESNFYALYGASEDTNYYGGFLDGMEWMAKTAKKCAIQNMTEAIKEHEEEIQRLETEQGEDIDPCSEKSKLLATFINNRKYAIKTLKKIRKALKRELKSGKIFENIL